LQSPGLSSFVIAKYIILDCIERQPQFVLYYNKTNLSVCPWFPSLLSLVLTIYMDFWGYRVVVIFLHLSFEHNILIHTNFPKDSLALTFAGKFSLTQIFWLTLYICLMFHIYFIQIYVLFQFRGIQEDVPIYFFFSNFATSNIP
jgi:hypothetical protein